jgi:hypothetical protein
VIDAMRFFRLCLRSPASLAAENLFLRKQLALYQERKVKPQRATDTTRIALVWLGRWFDWRQALAVVQPKTFIRWHRRAFRLFWRWKSRPGRPQIPIELQALIRRMARENPTWGQERIANELLLKLGLRVSPRTVRKYMPKRLDRGPGSRRIFHVNVTTHLAADWTLQQLREAIPPDHGYRFLIHDRDSIFSQALDQRIRNLGLRVLQTPPRSPQANAICERLIGTLRRECLDCVIPLTENHLGFLLQEWVWHYHSGRPHMSLGPGIPQPSASLPVPLQAGRHRLPGQRRVVAQPILGGLHYEYRLEEKAA